MRTFLGVLMVLVVSGEDKAITGRFGENVLLPCTCSERNLDKELKWQMETPNKTLVLIYSKNTLKFGGRYNGRARIFLPENSDNCSVLLTNITADDRGKYRCIFHSGEQYKKSDVDLNISGHSKIIATNQHPDSPQGPRYRYLKIIPITLLIVMFLVLWRRWKPSQSLPNKREVETDNFYC